jgi:hypothetical protein
MFAGRVTVTVDQRKLHSVSEDFVGKLLSRIAERADRETVSSAGLRLSGYEFLGLVEYAAEAMSGDLGISAGDVVAIRAFQGPIGLVIRYAAFSLGAIVFHIPDVGPSRQQAVIDAGLRFPARAGQPTRCRYRPCPPCTRPARGTKESPLATRSGRDTVPKTSLF